MDSCAPPKDLSRGGLRSLQMGGERMERMQARGTSQAQVQEMQQARRMDMRQTVEALVAGGRWRGACSKRWAERAGD